MGLIYIIRCSETSKVYIGQTIRDLKTRWRDHKYALVKYTRWVDGKLDKKPRMCTKLCRTMYKHGLDKFTIDILEEIDDKYLDIREMYYIEKYDSVINGYNITAGGGSNDHLNDNKAETISQFRKYKDELEGLPMFCIFVHDKEKDKEYITIRNHPLCNEKCFLISKYESLEKTKEAVILYLQELEKTGIAKTKHIKLDQSLPLGIKLTRNKRGYRVSKIINKINYSASFGMKMSNAENRKDAFEYLNKLLVRYNMTPVIDPLDIPEKDLLDEFNDWLNEDFSNYIPDYNPDNPIPISN